MVSALKFNKLPRAHAMHVRQSCFRRRVSMCAAIINTNESSPFSFLPASAFPSPRAFEPT